VTRPIFHLSILSLAIGLTLPLSDVPAASPFSPEEMDVFLDEACDAPKLELRMADGRGRLLFAEADASWDNANNHGGNGTLNLKQGQKKAAFVRFDLSNVAQRPVAAAGVSTAKEPRSL